MPIFQPAPGMKQTLGQRHTDLLRRYFPVESTPIACASHFNNPWSESLDRPPRLAGSTRRSCAALQSLNRSGAHRDYSSRHSERAALAERSMIFFPYSYCASKIGASGVSLAH
jgi:hypothetical protein